VREKERERARKIEREQERGRACERVNAKKRVLLREREKERVIHLRVHVFPTQNSTCGRLAAWRCVPMAMLQIIGIPPLLAAGAFTTTVRTSTPSSRRRGEPEKRIRAEYSIHY